MSLFSVASQKRSGNGKVTGGAVVCGTTGVGPTTPLVPAVVVVVLGTLQCRVVVVVVVVVLGDWEVVVVPINGGSVKKEGRKNVMLGCSISM